MKPPYSYEYINAHEGSCPPSFLKVHNTALAWFFKKYLLQDTFSIFEWTLPDNWDRDYFRYVLMGWGYLAVFKTDKFGVIPQQCGLTGYNVFYRPTMVTIANPLIRSRQLLIGYECELIKLMPDYSGVADLVDYYGDLMALTYETAATNVLNSKLAYAFVAETNAEAEGYKALYDKIASGEPAVVQRGKKNANGVKEQPWQTFTQNLSQNFIAPDVLETLRQERDNFLTEIGIPNLATRKKERTLVDEVNKNTAETMCKAELWLEELREGVKKVKDMFPDECEKLSVKLRFEGGEIDDVGDNERVGTVSV